MTKTLVTGGSGLIGTHLKDVMPDAIYVSSKDFDLRKSDEVDKMISHYQPKTLIHLAARVGGILDNINYPVDYFEENILMNTNILKKCHEHNVKNLLTILSTCIYPDKVETYPMKEDELFSGPPTPTNFSYAFSKRSMAVHIDAYKQQYNKAWSYLIPCNLYGEYDKFEEHNSHFVSALIKKIYESNETLDIWGTGKPLRQFMYAGDLARIIKYVLDNKIIKNLNVAPSYVHSIDEIVKIAIKASKKEHLKIVYNNDKKLDGQYRKDVDSSKLLSEIGEFRFTSLDEGIKIVYDKFSTRHN